jgi:hypothetical protein
MRKATGGWPLTLLHPIEMMPAPDPADWSRHVKPLADTKLLALHVVI